MGNDQLLAQNPPVLVCFPRKLKSALGSIIVQAIRYLSRQGSSSFCYPYFCESSVSILVSGAICAAPDSAS